MVGGVVTMLDGHYAILPLSMYHNGAILRSGDPIPQHGEKSRAAAIDCLKPLAASLHAEHPDWNHTLP